MRLEQLEYLIEISKHHSLSGAAQKLYLTSQALSKSITALEEELSLTLLDRTFKGVRLTTKGEQLVDSASRFIEELRLLQSKDEPLAAELAGEYTLPIIYGYINTFTLALLVELTKDFPRLQLDMPHHIQRVTVEMIQNEEADIAMCCSCALEDRELTSFLPPLRFTPLLPCRLVAMVPKRFPIANYSSISLKSLSPYPILLSQHNEQEPSELLQLLCCFADSWHTITRPSFVLCQELAIAGYGVFVHSVFHNQAIPKQHLQQVTYLPIRDRLRIQYGYLQKEGRTMRPETAVILQYIHKLAESMLV